MVNDGRMPGCASCKKRQVGTSVRLSVVKHRLKQSCRCCYCLLPGAIQQRSTKNDVGKKCSRDRTESFADPVWLFLEELTLLANVRVRQARSLVTTIVPSGPVVLSLPLKCVHYTVVDNKQKDG